MFIHMHIGIPKFICERTVFYSYPRDHVYFIYLVGLLHSTSRQDVYHVVKITLSPICIPIIAQYIPILYPHHYWNTPSWVPHYILRVIRVSIMISPFTILFSYPKKNARNSGVPLRASRISASSLHQTMKTSCRIILRSGRPHLDQMATWKSSENTC